ncbi:Hypothetical protein EMIHUDRAFT_228049 [Emiliania huxleyi CCMP1516]|uniref:Small ribosomal subunit protein uS10 domain-containing protein n=2 Tax=Emiliania huxleyi TaxID=2903 RepID=A0A0D3KGX0_EMIH1|nr:Hypothetical protein EMIHUDRAFT_228049 [Emiliania huxleyi CCMP1516]EOD35005.1 Hypothetical protein EMIHUDRAFT_228049 [Emiliania huxleyi CCMP1516]|eukprot:XP_005787434.1 Hypothetical protein EMIHUDRAFT_228049 [Emiliania huxleyi CCMP1516]
MVRARGQRLASIQLKGWIKQVIEAACDDVQKSTTSIGLRTSGTVRLPTERERWSYARLTYNRLIEIYGEGTQSHDATKTVHFLRYLEHTILPAHAGARAKVTLFSNELQRGYLTLL